MLVSSNFTVMMRSVEIIFENGYTYSHSSNKGDFVKLEEKTFPINIKGILKGLEIYGFGIFEYSVRSENGHMITLRYQAYHVHGLPNIFRITSPT